MKTGSLVGPRGERNRSPSEVINDAHAAIKRCAHPLQRACANLNALKIELADDCRAYYALAACSRRRLLEPGLRGEALALLYRLRSMLERCVIERLSLVADKASVAEAAFARSFFGVSSKQGVSIRYPLLTCIPTASCGGRCYAHDGRDRELHLIFRACLNYFVGKSWEEDQVARENVSRRLGPIIRYGVKMSVLDGLQAGGIGRFMRAPRIRFSHIGEMISTPQFANWLAREIKRIDDRVVCVAYSRHTDAHLYDPELFIVNFTVDGADDSRLKHKPRHARLVASAWDGELVELAEINFLEHHVEKGTQAHGRGSICPVTLNHGLHPSCDAAGCDKCFRHRL